MLAWQYVTYDYGLVVPEGTNVNELDPELKAFIYSLEPEWAAFPAFGTRPFNGMAILNVRMKCKLTKQQLEDLFLSFGLTWRVGAIRSAYQVVEGDYDYPVKIDKAGYLNYADDIMEYTDMETFTNRRPTMSDTINISMFSGTDLIDLS